MKIIRGINKIKRFKKPVVALGVFDGVHRGHALILKETVRRAHKIGGTSVVVTFWPHPQKEESLYSLEHRLRLIAALGIDACIVIDFTRYFAQISALEFIRNILVKGIGAREIYVGENFRFGKNAEGDCEFLKRLALILQYRVKIFKVIRTHHAPISSTYIRLLIKKGKLKEAQNLLARPVSVLGTVIKGNRIGRRLGFPTANIDPHHEVIPPKGIYAVKIILGKKIFRGACYIGTRPTFDRKNKKVHIEVYIFNLNRNIYTKFLEIQFIKRIRDDRKFASISRLAERIKKDILLIKNLLSRT